MYTQCPECQTIFELGIDELKAAEGQVCCGECDKVFNALASLTELPDEAVVHRRRAEDQEDPDNDANDEQNAAVSGDLFEGVDLPADEQQEPQADSSDDDEQDEMEAAAAENEGVDWDPDGQVVPEQEIGELEQNLWEQKLAELGLADQDANETAPANDELEDDQHAAGSNESNLQPETENDTAAAESDALDAADWLGTPEPVRRPAWPWAVASVLAGLALVAQAIHYWHEDLARTPALEPWLKSLYRNLGEPIPEEWDVHAYRVAKDTVSNHPEDAGALLVNASVANDAPRPQPYPLLKITLLDRWGEPIGERFFAPAEYLASRAATDDLIGAGETAEASVLIVDPGAGAVSYGIDACLRDADNHLLCAHEGEY